MKTGGRTVITRSYSLTPAAISWIEDFGKKTQRTNSQVVQLAVQMFKDRISNSKEELVY